MLHKSKRMLSAHPKSSWSIRWSRNKISRKESIVSEEKVLQISLSGRVGRRKMLSPSAKVVPGPPWIVAGNNEDDPGFCLK